MKPNKFENETSQIVEADNQNTTIRRKKTDFIQGERILYKNETYHILDVQPKKIIHLKIEESARFLKVTSKDGLYHSLLNAKLNSKNVLSGSTIGS